MWFLLFLKQAIKYHKGEKKQSLVGRFSLKTGTFLEPMGSCQHWSHILSDHPAHPQHEDRPYSTWQCYAVPLAEHGRVDRMPELNLHGQRHEEQELKWATGRQWADNSSGKAAQSKVHGVRTKWDPKCKESQSSSSQAPPSGISTEIWGLKPFPHILS